VDRKKNINFFVHDYCTLQASIFQKWNIRLTDFTE
jgi:hypothetical protein